MASSRALLALVAGVTLSAGARAEPLVGPSVGNADTLVSEASKLFNRKQYAKAAELFLKASRANPGAVTTYLQLARAQTLAKQLQPACYAYRVYLKAAPDSPDRKKASAEGDQCERQLKGLKRAPPDPGPKYVEVRAAFFAALDARRLLGADGAAAALTQLVDEGFLGPDLGDMAQKLGVAAAAQADDVHQRALGGEAVLAETLRSARPLYQLAQDVGVTAASSKGRMAFLDGMADLSDRAFKDAEAHFAEAAKLDPANREYVFFKALALFQGGERQAALKALEAGLKDDPRTAVLRVALAVGHAPDAGAAELERLLFTARVPPEK
jgi:tetratricopeptide (TPR) repeat protein